MNNATSPTINITMVWAHQAGTGSVAPGRMTSAQLASQITPLVGDLVNRRADKLFDSSIRQGDVSTVNFYGYSMMEQVDGLTVNGDVTDYQIKFHPVSNKQIFDDPRQGSGAETLNVLVVGNPDIAPQITQPLRRMATKKSNGLPNYDLILGAWGTDRAETVQITDLAGVVWKKASPINPK